MSAGEAKIDPCSDPSAPARRVPLSLTALGRVAEVVGECAAEPLQIGPYILRERIGDGGMGVVYRAEQQHPIQRTVALKLIKPGMDSREVIARFESERQALAMMSHKNVATVLDAGTSDDGRPYFVMEYVPGEPITRHCDVHRLTLKQRLELFIQACDAVQHAHQKAIIHRDLKPSNILVTGENGDAEVKVIDFGVAKALRPTLEQQHTLYTHASQLIGTPDYMSPEQASSVGHGVDTRSDIYSMGVVLYELLTGALPFDPKTLRSSGVAEIQRILREVDPPRPSTRLSTLGETASAMASNRHTQLHELTRQLRGELEWIPLKAMRKEPEQRYASAGELVEDVRNYLEHKPLIAGPESRVYRVQKFVRRNKRPVIAAVSTALLLLIGVAVSTSLAIRLKATADAVRAEQARTVDALMEAETAREVAEAVRDFLAHDVLGGAKPERVRDSAIIDAIVKAMVDPAAAKVGDQFKDKPLVEAEVRYSLAQSYWALGRSDLALPHIERALHLFRSAREDGHRDTLETLSEYTVILQTLGRYADAEIAIEEALDLSRNLLDQKDPFRATLLHNYGLVMQARGRLPEAEAAYSESLRLGRELRGHADPKVYTTLDNYAAVLESLGRAGEAEPLFRDAMEGRERTLGADHPLTIHSLNNYGWILKALGRYREAEEYFARAAEQGRRVLGDDHPATVVPEFHRVRVVLLQGRFDDAGPLVDEAIARLIRTFGESHPLVLPQLRGLATAYAEQGRLEEIEPRFRDLVERRRASRGDDDPATLEAVFAHARVLQGMNELSSAEALHREVVERADRTLGAGHPQTITWLNGLGLFLHGNRRLGQAELIFRQGLAALRAGTPNQSVRHRESLALILHHLANLLQEQEKFDEARSLAEEAVALYADNPSFPASEHDHAYRVLSEILAAQDDLPRLAEIQRDWLGAVRVRVASDSPVLAASLAQVALASLRAEQFAEAEAAARECLAIRDIILPDDWVTFNTKSMLGGALLGQQKYAEAEPLLLAGYGGLKEREAVIPAGGKGRIPEAIQRLVQLYDATGRQEDAARWREELRQWQGFNEVRE